ncbi:TetR/AcrR family transcriptional regulator [Acinetobacter sp. ANC 4945]|uniref:TetR family transcriptional regulator n=1 Tax=Acinetobacter amyesii TaxID=2942470 RepID=A0A1T1GQI4_9GAMM|nr:TetR/AcrR family transcriptional regulator [Acinetobacter amyesii]MCL6247814.1 TetR/AcrR family transcriptional regulator [Acinetobacter amyesii]OOV79838.1 TetR family transcriptional regulator [Acinetobacter amyesii]
MRYKPEYKQQKRQELLNITGQIAKKNGFAATGVDGLMQAAGVTSGAFYSHFSSKQDLLKALVEYELQQSFNLWQSNPHHNAADWINFELDRYLTPSHLEHPEQGCVLPTLATEVARADDTIKQAYEKELLRGHALFSTHLASEEKAWAMMSQLVGAVLIARAMHDPELQKSILQANKMIIQDYLAAHSAA